MPGGRASHDRVALAVHPLVAVGVAGSDKHEDLFERARAVFSGLPEAAGLTAELLLTYQDLLTKSSYTSVTCSSFGPGDPVAAGKEEPSFPLLSGG